MRVTSCWIAIGLLLPAAAPGQTPAAPSFASALTGARSPPLLASGAFSGTGATVLDTAVDQARFVLVGEDHMTREIPRFVAALCDEMHPDAYAVEVGPYAARYVNGLLHSPNRIADMAARDRHSPDNMAFLNIREENDLAAHCAASSRNPQFALWGLDQEFLGSAGVLLAQMAATNPGPKSRAAITAAQAEQQADAAQALRTGNFGALFLLSSESSKAIAVLGTAVAADGTQTTRELDEELATSWKIYALHSQSALGASVQARAELLKQHFLADYVPFQRQHPNGRILFKLGDNHTGKGLNWTHDLDLGDFVAEQAAEEQVKSLHILVLGLRGMHYTMPGYGKPMGQEPFTMSSDPDYAWMQAASDAMEPQPGGSLGTMLTLFDLRALRYRSLALSPGWEHVIYSYDLLVVFPSLSVASEIR